VKLTIFLTFILNVEILHRIMLVPQNIVMDLNNVMEVVTLNTIFNDVIR